MSRRPRREPSQRGNGSHTKVETDSVFSSGDWEGLPRRLQAETDLCSERWQARSEEADEEISHFSYPQVGFCDGKPARRQRPLISDLSKEDKQRIATLVKELARYREQEKDRHSQVKSLTDENDSLKTKIGKLEKELNCLQLAVKYSEENVRLLGKSFTDKETGLREQNSDLRDKLMAFVNEKSDLQTKLKESQEQTEKLSRAIYNVTMENKMINKKYEHTKEKLKRSLEMVNRLEADYEQNATVPKENKLTQTEIPIAISSTHRTNTIRRKEEKKFHRGLRWRYEAKERESSDEDSLISELFFIPKQKNQCRSQYTSDDEYF